MTPIIEETKKPQSMPTGPRNVLRSNDSASLWNCTLSPGWSRDECDILRKALMKYGIGNWAQIIGSNCLPGKTNAQMNLQLQRMLGQQSTAEFAGLHIDPLVIGEKNSKIQGLNIKRKNNCIVNTGNRPSREEIKRRIQKNKELFEIPEEEWNKIELPKPEDVALNSKYEELRRLQDELADSQEIITNELNESSSIKEEVNSDNAKQRRSTRKSKKTRRS
ncbi:5141_t:CDS:2 [Funneliformis mosseae]|uniref:5141_t:CDS:1 n=1 Tax=Funneliformis mosseae TaxID=27381 RepID=A0A9N8VB35_FUNMO|nr:5141_t:CDS:2 [Funneliformis mosseae]